MNLNSFSRAHWLLTTFALVLLAGAGGYWLAGRKDPADMPSAASAERKVLYWQDPMKPDVKFDKPGKSPFMDMQLVPVYADEAGADNGVRISANVSQNLGIRLGKVERSAFGRTFVAVGSVGFDETRLAVIPARVEGYVTRIFVHSPLERVRRGQPLAEVQAPAWLEAQQEYLALLDAESQAARALRDAARERLRVLGVPEATVRRIETERKTDATTTITAPIDGVISELGVREGAAFAPGAPLFRLNSLSTVWVNARIPEANVSLVARGSKVTATATSWPGATFEGTVIALLPEVDPLTRTLTARAQLENTDGRLAPGMFVSLTFTAPMSEPQLTVPSEAVIATGQRSVVIVAKDDGSFGVVNVTTGAESGGRTEIIAGLTEGQSIVSSGQFLIDSEASLKSTGSRIGGATVETDASAPKDGNESMPSTTGTIKAIDEKKVTLDHGAVSALNWPPMVMGFLKPANGMPDGLKVGDAVKFTFKEVEGGYQIESISAADATPSHEGHKP